MDKLKINNTEIKILRDDLTNMEVDAIVFYAKSNLSLGSGYGNAISTRGGPSIKTELEKIGIANQTEAVVTKAGNLNCKFIIHAVGPAFQEKDMIPKLKTTISNALNAASSYEIETIALPLMGAGFYGVPVDLSVKTMYDCVKEYAGKNGKIKEVIFCANDNRELKLIKDNLTKLNQGV